MTQPQPMPGDYVLVHEGGDGGKLIRTLQYLNGSGFSDYEHAALYVGNGQITEMAASGIQAGSVTKYLNDSCRWSTNDPHISLTGPQRMAVVDAAHHYLDIGVKYSWEDYGALALHHFHIPAPGLQAYIEDTHHMICSQLVDQCYRDAGVQLFNDKRWPGFVTPGDLDQILGI
jgi:hypothetical protein